MNDVFVDMCIVLKFLVANRPPSQIDCQIESACKILMQKCVVLLHENIFRIDEYIKGSYVDAPSYLIFRIFVMHWDWHASEPSRSIYIQNIIWSVDGNIRYHSQWFNYRIKHQYFRRKNMAVFLSHCFIFVFSNLFFCV